jgi:hypothetical protein
MMPDDDFAFFNETFVVGLFAAGLFFYLPIMKIHS